MDGRRELSLREAVEWRPLLWGRATAAALDMARELLTPGSTVLEVGYGSGLMSCYLASRFGVRVIGYELAMGAERRAYTNVERFGLKGEVEPRAGNAIEVFSGPKVDVVFMKSVLFRIGAAAEYRRWLWWCYDILRPGGCLILVENGRGGRVTSYYRRYVLRAWYWDKWLIDSATLYLLRGIFPDVKARYFGRYSQFCGEAEKVYNLVEWVENRGRLVNEEKCFVAAIVARKEKG